MIMKVQLKGHNQITKSKLIKNLTKLPILPNIISDCPRSWFGINFEYSSDSKGRK